MSGNGREAGCSKAIRGDLVLFPSAAVGEWPRVGGSQQGRGGNTEGERGGEWEGEEVPGHQLS